ncbi:hypothetical protein [Ancylomarina longa]|uniref:hypothetical protein n=1 Tax=Ancylomarina longa TaxID=2487017 RepID=UPI000FCA0261|nr:hypothetical protein [Ancylomarina longa]
MQQNQVDLNYAHDFFEVDHFGYIYVVNNSEIVKFDSKGRQICSFANSSLGTISSVDVSDPLRILLFYKNFNQILFLDRNLSKIGTEIDLYDFSDNETEQVCSSQKGGFWIYNSNENQAFHISAKGGIISESLLVNSIYDALPVRKIKEYNSNLFLFSGNQDVIKLDQNGQFLAKIHLPDKHNISFYKNTFQYQKNSAVYEYNAKSQSDSLLYKIPTGFIKAILFRDKIYLSNEKSISIRNISF